MYRKTKNLNLGKIYPKKFTKRRHMDKSSESKGGKRDGENIKK